MSDNSNIGKKVTLISEMIEKKDSDRPYIKKYKNALLKYADQTGVIKSVKGFLYNVAYGKKELTAPKDYFVVLDEFAKGGKIVVSSISDIPDLQNKVDAGKVTYRGLGIGKLSNDFYKLTGDSGVRIKVDGKEYFITDADYRKLNWDFENKKWLGKIKFDAPFRKSYADGGVLTADERIEYNRLDQELLRLQGEYMDEEDEEKKKELNKQIHEIEDKIHRIERKDEYAEGGEIRHELIVDLKGDKRKAWMKNPMRISGDEINDPEFEDSKIKPSDIKYSAKTEKKGADPGRSPHFITPDGTEYLIHSWKGKKYIRLHGDEYNRASDFDNDQIGNEQGLKTLKEILAKYWNNNIIRKGYDYSQRKKIIKQAIVDKKYQQAISEGRITALDAAEIIAGADEDVPSGILDVATKEGFKEKRYADGGTIEDRVLPEEYYKTFRLKGNGRREYTIFQSHSDSQYKQAGKQILPPMGYKNHIEYAKEFLAKEKSLLIEHGQLVEKEFLKQFKRPYEVYDYKVSGIVRDEFSDEVKDKLRKLIRQVNEYGHAYLLHNAFLKKADKVHPDFAEGGVIIYEPKVGQHAKLTNSDGSVSQGYIYEVSPGNKSVRLVDPYGNKSEKWFNLNNAKKVDISDRHQFKLGDKYRNDFDYTGMLESALSADGSWSANKFKKLYESSVDVNYHDIARIAWDIYKRMEAKEDVKEQIVDLHKVAKENLDSTGFEKGGKTTKNIDVYFKDEGDFITVIFQTELARKFAQERGLPITEENWKVNVDSNKAYAIKYVCQKDAGLVVDDSEIDYDEFAQGGMTAEAEAAFHDVVEGMSEEEFNKKHKVGDYHQYKSIAQKHFGKFYIYVIPKNEAYPPHIWQEGGVFKAKQSAQHHADECKKTKLYSKVEVRPLIGDQAEYFISVWVKLENEQAYRYKNNLSKYFISSLDGVKEEAKKIAKKAEEVFGGNAEAKIANHDKPICVVYSDGTSDDITEFKRGGRLSKFDKLSNRVAREYKGEKVAPEYQGEYGKIYDAEEAHEVGDKVAGKIAHEKGFAEGGEAVDNNELIQNSQKYRATLDAYAKSHNEEPEIYNRAVDLLDEMSTKAQDDENLSRLVGKWLTDGSTLVLQDILRKTSYKGNTIDDRYVDFNAFALLDTVSLHYHEGTKFAKGGETENLNQWYITSEDKSGKQIDEKKFKSFDKKEIAKELLRQAMALPDGGEVMYAKDDEKYVGDIIMWLDKKNGELRQIVIKGAKDYRKKFDVDNFKKLNGIVDEFEKGGLTSDQYTQFERMAYQKMKEFFAGTDISVWKSLSLHNKSNNHVFRPSMMSKKFGKNNYEVVISYYHGQKTESSGYVSYNSADNEFTYDLWDWNIKGEQKFEQGGSASSEIIDNDITNPLALTTLIKANVLVGMRSAPYEGWVKDGWKFYFEKKNNEWYGVMDGNFPHGHERHEAIADKYIVDTLRQINPDKFEKGGEVENKFSPSDLPKDGSPINIHTPALGNWPAQDIVLKYDSKNFNFSIEHNGKKQGRIGEKNVLDNLNNGLYELSDKNKMAEGGLSNSDSPSVVENPKPAIKYANDVIKSNERMAELNKKLSEKKKELTRFEKKMRSKDKKLHIEGLNNVGRIKDEIRELDNDERSSILEDLHKWDGFNNTRRANGDLISIYEFRMKATDPEFLNDFIEQEKKAEGRFIPGVTIEKFKHTDTVNSGGIPIKKNKYNIGDKVYSWQNPDEAKPVGFKRYSPWIGEGTPHPNDTWKYTLNLQNEGEDQKRSKWMSEDSLSEEPIEKEK